MGLFSSGLSRNTKWEFSARGRILTFPAIADVNGDGLLEVVFGSDDRAIYALRGSDGGLAWTFETEGPVRSSPTVADINGDGVMEVVFGSDDYNIYCLNGVDGRVLWTVRSNGPIRSPAAVGDVNCDGKLEVIVSGDDSSVYAIDGVSGELLWQSSHRGGRSSALLQSAPCLEDLDGDGRLEIVTGSASNHILVYDSEGSLIMRKEFEAPSFNSSVAVADVNGDGKAEIVAASDNGVVYLTTSEAQTLWSRVAGVGIRSAPVVADINDDGRMEILLHVSPDLGGDGKLICLGAEGDMLWEMKLSGAGTSAPIPADLDNDGGVEISAFSAAKGIMILTPDGGEKTTAGARGVAVSGPGIADVDGDGVVEYVYSLSDRKVACFGSRFGGRYGQIHNPGARGNNRNTGSYRTLLQLIADLKRNAEEVKAEGGNVGVALQSLLKAEREQGKRDVSPDLEEVHHALSMERARLRRRKERVESLAKMKEKMKFFSSLDVDGASSLAMAVSRIESLIAQGKDVEAELEAAEALCEELEEKSKEKVQSLNAKRLSFLVGQFLEKFPDPMDSDVEEFIEYLRSENLPFLPYEIKKAIEERRKEQKFRSLRDSGRFDFMSEEEKAVAIGGSLAESIIQSMVRTMRVPISTIKRQMDQVSADYTNIPRLVITDDGKILTDELRKTLKNIPPEKVIAASVSLFSLYLTKLFDLYQELTDFETAYTRFKTSIDHVAEAFGAEEIVSQFQEKACHGIFAEEVRVKRILDL